MNNRIVVLRMNLYLSHSQFAESIGIGLSSLLKIELGKLIVTDEVISSICKRYYVNEMWLRFGIGEAFCLSSEQFDSTSSNKLTPLQSNIINTIINLDKEFLNETMFQFMNFFNLISNDIITKNEKNYINKQNIDYSAIESNISKKKKKKLLILLNIRKNAVLIKDIWVLDYFTKSINRCKGSTRLDSVL